MSLRKTIFKARYLRKEQTIAEEILWKELRNKKLEIRFRRQHPIDMYIIDFYAPEIKLAIELDGSTHKSKDAKEYDRERTDYLELKYINEIRFWNSEIAKDLNKVLNIIKEKIKGLES